MSRAAAKSPQARTRTHRCQPSLVSSCSAVCFSRSRRNRSRPMSRRARPVASTTARHPRRYQLRLDHPKTHDTRLGRRRTDSIPPPITSKDGQRLEPDPLLSAARRNIRSEHPRQKNRSARLAIAPDRDRRIAPPSHRPIRVKAAGSFPASIRNIRMANHHTQNSLSRSLRPRADVTTRSTGAALRPVADDVAPTQSGISLDRRAVRERPREAGSRVEPTIHHLVRRGPSTVLAAHEATPRT